MSCNSIFLLSTGRFWGAGQVQVSQRFTEVICQFSVNFWLADLMITIEQHEDSKRFKIKGKRVCLDRSGIQYSICRSHVFLLCTWAPVVHVNMSAWTCPTQLVYTVQSIYKDTFGFQGQQDFHTTSDYGGDGKPLHRQIVQVYVRMCL